MPTIPFSLQPVLSYKESLVDLFGRQLAQLFSERKVIETALVALHQERRQMRVRVVVERQGVLHLDRLWHYQVYLDWLGERIDEREKELAEMDARIEEKRRELLAAMQEKRMLEKLKERATERFMAEMERREATLHDEIATTRFAGLSA